MCVFLLLILYLHNIFLNIPNFLGFSQYLTEETGFIINFQGWRVVFQSDSVVKEKIKSSWAQHFVPCTSWENMAWLKFKTPGNLKPKTLILWRIGSQEDSAIYLRTHNTLTSKLRLQSKILVQSSDLWEAVAKFCSFCQMLYKPMWIYQ